MHLGNLRTALYAYLFARHMGGTFILRIEDTAQEREVPGAVEKIYRSLEMAGWDHDEARTWRRLRPLHPDQRGISTRSTPGTDRARRCLPLFLHQEALDARRAEPRPGAKPISTTSIACTAQGRGGPPHRRG
jgi:hypothetical protein